MTVSLGIALVPDEVLQSIDDDTAVYCASDEMASLDLTRELLATLQKATSDGTLESQLSCVGSSGLSGRSPTAVEVVQNCCCRWWECRAEVEEAFLQLYYTIHTVTVVMAPENGAAPILNFLADLFAGVPGTVGVERLAEALQVDKSWLAFANVPGLPSTQLQKEEAKQLPLGISLLKQILDSFCVVTDEKLPAYLYCTLQPLFCEMKPCWLLNGFFADTPLRLVGTEEALKRAKNRLELHASSLRFLLKLAEEDSDCSDSATALEQKKQLEEMLLCVTAMQSAFTESWICEQVSSGWPRVVEDVRKIISSADKTVLGGLPEEIMAAFDALLQLSPHRVMDHIVHCFLLPLSSGLLDNGVGGTKLDDDAPTVAAAVGASFDGMSLEEVEYLLQPSDPDETSTIETDGDTVSARIYLHFYRTFKMLMRACGVQKAQVVVMLWPFFDLQTSPFLRTVPPARLETMLRCHSYALFDALEGAPCGTTAALLLGGGWVRTARDHFAQWLSERDGKKGQFPTVIFKQLWKEGDNGKATTSAQQALCIPLLRRIVTGCCGTLVNTKVAVLVPAGGATVLSRRYSVFPLMRHVRCAREKGTFDEPLGDGIHKLHRKMIEATSRPLLAALLQGTLMPVLSYSACGPVPISFVSDGVDGGRTC
ncbi:hypothetical protein TraAM80_00438 [Trypanosoma rangeli]|uniref:Uncharacterized protein n=1 Tax=Trypanosoma rangeli TaxID=5698 RepID=A0A3R7NV53_TRYRA|nr:uncharacterized protein TraAM80_00438 [Trypanosoma rangeli]RNF12290.1 hypothetical protein TraAM80_00438 [Trypanosoma rangeli]|eukprot:RNF12290.1 hypothetical protein TraAM80_00438 [Trypanosoma rangeli]